MSGFWDTVYNLFNKVTVTLIETFIISYLIYRGYFDVRQKYNCSGLPATSVR